MKVNFSNFFEGKVSSPSLVYILKGISKNRKIFIDIKRLSDILGWHPLFSHCVIFKHNLDIPRGLNAPKRGKMEELTPEASISHYDRDRDVCFCCEFYMNGSIELICNDDEYAEEVMNFLCSPFENVNDYWEISGNWTEDRKKIITLIVAGLVHSGNDFKFSDSIMKKSKKADILLLKGDYHKTFELLIDIIEQVIESLCGEENGTKTSLRKKKERLLKKLRIPFWIDSALDIIIMIKQSLKEGDLKEIQEHHVMISINTAAWFLSTYAEQEKIKYSVTWDEWCIK